MATNGVHAYLYKQAYAKLRQATHPIFIADERIDGDSLGSTLALLDHLLPFGVRPSVFVSREVPEKYGFLPHIERCVASRDVFNDPTIDLVVSCDCSDGAYVRRLVSLMPRRPFVVNIDHHATNPLYGDLNLVAKDASATCEVVHRLFVANNVLPSKAAATCLLCGICFDTTIFFNDATSARALAVASDLMRSGARIQDVVRTIFRNKSVAALRMWGVALDRLRSHTGLGLISTFLTRADMEQNGVDDDEVDGLSDFLNVVVQAETLCVLRETKDGGVKVSMRTSTRNVASVAQAFGGGGHVKAAGFTVSDSRIVCSGNGGWRVEEVQKTC